MLIAVTSSSSGQLILNPAQLTPSGTRTTASSSAGSSASSSSVTSPKTGSNAAGASSAAENSGGGHTRAGAGGGGASAASTAAEVETLVGTYTTTVGGTQYSGSVEEESGSYVASIPNLSGATATGATMIEAENNLSIRVDELV